MATLGGDGALRLASAAVTEELHNGETGVAQSWSFASMPAGTGDLVVRIRASGQHYAGRTAHGLHFVDRASGLGLRYGAATWVDAAGRRTEVGCSFENGEIVLRVPGPAVAAAAYPAVLDPLIGPELDLDQPVPGWAGWSQYQPALAFDGANYLVVWADARSWRTNDIYAARVTPAGAVLDPTGFAVAAGGDYGWSRGHPAVAFDGSNFLVVWEEGTVGANLDVNGTRVSPSGVVLDPLPFGIATAAGYQTYPAIAFDGTSYLVVWQDCAYPNDCDVRGARVSPAGVVLDSAGIAIATGAGSEQRPALAFGGASYLVVWEDRHPSGGTYVYGARVNPAGVVLEPAAIAIATGVMAQTSPTVAFDGANHLVVWMDWRDWRGQHLYGTRVSPAGTVLDPAGIAVSTAADGEWSPRLAFDGTDFLVVWEGWRSGGSPLYGARISSAGVLLDPAGLVLMSAADRHAGHALACHDTACLVVADDQPSAGRSHIVGVRMDAAGAVLDAAPFPVSTAANDESYAAVAFDGTNFLAVWADYRSRDDFDIYGARVSPAGEMLDPNGIAITTAANQQEFPALAFDGANYLVVWADLRSGSTADIYGARVSPAGTVLDPDGIAISTAANSQKFPALAFDGTNYLVVWQDDAATSSRVVGTRVRPGGAVLDPTGIVISTARSSQRARLAFDGTNHLVVWTDYRNGTVDGVYGARVSPAGIVLDPTGIGISTFASQHASAAVAFDGDNHFVLWMDYRGGAGANIYGARVSRTGLVLDPAGIAVSTTPGDQRYPAIAFDGASYCAVWEDYRGGALPEVYGAWLAPDGTVLDPGGVALSTAPAAGTYPSVASDGAGLAMLVYHRFATDPDHRSLRVFGRLLHRLHAGATCTAADECASGHCVDGVCCDTLCGDGDQNDCQACHLPGRLGRCTTSEPGAVCRGAAAACDIAETCDGASTLCPPDGLADSSVQCRAASCSTGRETRAANCTGATADCPPPVTQACGLYICGVIACAHDCAAPGDCVIGSYCDQGACAPKLESGAPCRDDTACIAGQCVDGVCCDRPCPGQCEACDLAGSEGTCTLVTAGAPRGARASCAGSGVCAGTCDGTNADACGYPSAECSPARCADGVQTTAAFCDGAGACGGGLTTACGDYRCGATACLTACGGDTDCAPGLTCLAGACEAPQTDGGRDAEPAPDEGASDAAMKADAPPPDAPLNMDAASLVDAGADGDAAGVGDTGVPLDAPASGMTPRGCECATASSGRPDPLVCVLALALLLRRPGRRRLGGRGRRRHDSAEPR